VAPALRLVLPAAGNGTWRPDSTTWSAPNVRSTTTTARRATGRTPPAASAPLWCSCGAHPAHWSRQQRTPGSSTWGFHMERVTRIELALSAWEADVLPLNYTRVRRRLGRCRMPAHSTSCLAPGVEAVGPGGVSEGGRACGGPELGRYGGGVEEGPGGTGVPLGEPSL
jgi:hypothetical protein